MSQVIKFPITRQSRKRFSLLDKCRAYQFPTRDLTPRLNDLEYRMLMLLVDRTAGKGRTRVTLTNGEIATGCNSSRRSIQRAQQALLWKGFIAVIYTGRGHSFTVKTGPNAMHHPKRVLGRTKVPMRQVGTPDAPPARTSIIETSLRVETSIEKTIPFGSSPPADASPSTSKERVQQAGEAAGMKLTPATADRTSRKVTELRKTWVSAHSDIGVDCPMVWASRRQRGKVKGAHWAGELAEVWPADDTPGLHAFLYWCVTHWNEIMAGELFNWMKHTESVPNIRFIYQHHERLYGAWRGRAKEDWRHGPNAREISRLRQQGKIKEAEALMKKPADG